MLSLSVGDISGALGGGTSFGGLDLNQIKVADVLQGDFSGVKKKKKPSDPDNDDDTKFPDWDADDKSSAAPLPSTATEV